MRCSCGRAGTSPGMDLCTHCEEDHWVESLMAAGDASGQAAPQDSEASF